MSDVEAIMDIEGGGKPMVGNPMHVARPAAAKATNSGSRSCLRLLFKATAGLALVGAGFGASSWLTRCDAEGYHLTACPAAKAPSSDAAAVEADDVAPTFVHAPYVPRGAAQAYAVGAGSFTYSERPVKSACEYGFCRFDNIEFDTQHAAKTCSVATANKVIMPQLVGRRKFRYSDVIPVMAGGVEGKQEEYEIYRADPVEQVQCGNEGPAAAHAVNSCFCVRPVVRHGREELELVTPASEAWDACGCEIPSSDTHSARRRRLTAVGGEGSLFGCDKGLPRENLPGAAQFGKGYNFATGALTKTAVLGGASFDQGALYQYNGKCYKIPDMFVDVKEGQLGVDFSHQVARTGFDSLSGKDTVSFQHNWGSSSSDDFSLGVSGYGASLSAAYTNSEEMSHVRENTKENHKSIVQLTRDFSRYTADPQTADFLPGTISTWKTLLGKSAPYKSNDPTMPTWHDYFQTHGTHIVTRFSIGGRMHVQSFFKSNDASSSSADMKKQEQCIKTAASGTVLSVKIDAKADHCWGSNSDVKAAMAAYLASTSSSSMCDGAALACPAVGAGEIKEGAYAAWTQALDKEPTTIVRSAEWIDRRLLQMMNQDPKYVTETLQMDEKEAKVLLDTMRAMLQEFIAESGLCTAYPGACGFESDALDLIASNVTALVTSDVPKAVTGMDSAKSAVKAFAAASNGIWAAVAGGKQPFYSTAELTKVASPPTNGYAYLDAAEKVAEQDRDALRKVLEGVKGRLASAATTLRTGSGVTGTSITAAQKLLADALQSLATTFQAGVFRPEMKTLLDSGKAKVQTRVDMTNKGKDATFNSAWSSAMRSAYVAQEDKNCLVWIWNVIAFPVCMGNVAGVADKDLESAKTAAASTAHLQFTTMKIPFGTVETTTTALNGKASPLAAELAQLHLEISQNVGLTKVSASTTYWTDVMLPKLDRVAGAIQKALDASVPKSATK